MLRSELVSKLEIIAPAILPDSIVPALSHFWFTGERAMAYNETIALSIPLKTEFQGAIPGTLLKILKASRAKEVELTPGKDSIEVKAARTRLKLVLLDPSVFSFTMPKTDSYGSLDHKPGQRFLQAIDQLMISVGDDPLQPDQCGVTIIQEEDKALLFTTNRSTIAHVKLPELSLLKNGTRVILPTSFCQQMTKLQSPAMGLRINADHACFYSGKIEMWGRLLTSKTPLDFVSVTQKLLPDENDSTHIPISMSRVVERILIIADDKDSSMKMTVKNARCKFELSSSRGEIFDSVPFPDHPDVSVMIKPKWVKPIGDFTDMTLTDRCLTLQKDNAFYMVATGS